MSDSRPEERSSIALTLPFTSIRQIRHSKNVASRFSEQTISFPAEKDEMPGLELLSGIAVHKIQLPRQQDSVKISFIGRNTKAFATGGETGDAFRENYKLRTATMLPLHQPSHRTCCACMVDLVKKRDPQHESKSAFNNGPKSTSSQ